MSRDWQRDYRLLSSPFRMLPDFVIPGEAKCGTTSLYRYLTQHPDVVAADRKEPRNFLDHPESRLFCRSHYPLGILKYLHAATGRRSLVTGEATAEYLSRQKVPAAIKRVVPGIKVIVVLRHPVARALSDYHMLKQNGMITLSFEDAVERTLDWLENEELADLVDAVSESEHFYGRLVLRGLYAKNLRRWLDVFGKQNVLVLGSESLFDNAQHCVDGVFGFLGLEKAKIDTVRIGRQGDYENTVDRALLARLAEFYRPHNESLYELIGEDFGWERQPLYGSGVQ